MLYRITDQTYCCAHTFMIPEPPPGVSYSFIVMSLAEVLKNVTAGLSVFKVDFVVAYSDWYLSWIVCVVLYLLTHYSWNM